MKVVGILLCIFLGASEFSKRLVEMIDSATEWEFSLDDCTKESLNIMINNTKSSAVVDKLLTFKGMEQNSKDKLIDKIFGDSNLKAKFSKEQISDFYFNDPSYISSWPIGKNTSIPKSGHEEQVNRWGRIMSKYGLTSKKSNNIMLKSLNDYFE